MSKKFLVIFLCVLFLAVVVVGCGQQKQFLNIATGGTAGTYFPMGGAMADIWNDNIKGMNATAQSTGASVANINLLKDKKVEVILTQNDIAFYSATGTEMFKDDKFDNLKGLITLYPEVLHIIAKADSGIVNFKDLKGKRVAVGAPGSGNEANARQLIEAAGMTYADIDEQYLSYAEAADNFKDGNIDAVMLTTGVPNAAVMDMAATHKIVIVKFEDEVVKKVMTDYPFYTAITIPANSYNGVTQDVQTMAVKAMLAVSGDMKDAVAYDLVKYIYENTDKLLAVSQNGKYITIDSGLDGMPIELHAGAKKFFDEKKK
ncbi:MAG: C4-dicarboxylate ABC transporter substrate-binding protein [Peptococcaceae bacterium BICA1-8]|nr:MAG: C4-dicarboxylate ABC transporter substrate-binding protein [Peptococcaceae bacterium BICA1-8]